jgi:cell division protein FtsB
MIPRNVTLLLLALLLLVLGQLFIGRGSLPNVARLQKSLDAQIAGNAKARLANERLAAEVRDLNEGLETVEERARFELGMVKPNEIFVQVSR